MSATAAQLKNPLHSEPIHSVRQLPLSQLEKISRQLAATQDPKAAEKLKKRFMEGYYGKPLHLLHAEDTAI